jgi:putative PEP-CTERM system integral membrane protein
METHTTPMIDSDLNNNDSKSPYSRLEWVQFFLFWSWNLVFLAFMSLGFGPVMLPEMFTAVRTGMLPVGYLVYALVLVMVPVAAVILGLTVLRRSPGRLFALGYVVEGPLMLLLAVRFFLIRQAMPGIAMIFLLALLGLGTFLWRQLDLRQDRRPILEAVRLVGLTLMAIVSLYAATWLAFYALPIGTEALRALIDWLSELPQFFRALFRDLGSILREPPQPWMFAFRILGILLLLYTATLVVLAPLAVPYLSLSAWLRALRAQARQLGWVRPLVLVVLVLGVSAGLFYFSNLQPQGKAFSLLESSPASTEDVLDLLEQSEVIRTGLLNAYLAPFRYISAEGEVRHVRDLYFHTFNFSQEKAYSVQRMYESVASPLLYKPVNRPDPKNPIDNFALVEEPQEAARLYQSFFDTPIVEAERPTIVRAVRSTWSIDQAEAAWQAVDEREVRLVRQELSLAEHGDWAELELHEAYQNQTADLQEVIYYFNMPESAVLTGVWLGSSPDKSQAFVFQVAPRGAAQAVYREQTRVMRDPALLEQIGPRQYRLRVYPIPPLQLTYNQQRARTLVEDAPLHYMWVSWRQMASPEGWLMPRLALVRNVYWDEDTERSLNGQEQFVPGEAGSMDTWLPAELPMTAPFSPQIHRVDLPGSRSVLVVPAEQLALPDLPAGLRLAVVLDRSRSMEIHAGEATQDFEQLQQLEQLSAIDVYLTASPYRGEEPSVVSLQGLDPRQVLYFGGQNAAQLLVQFDQLYRAAPEGKAYDAVLMFTDGSGYELGPSEEQAPLPPFPLWVVHLGGDISLGYDDKTLEAIQASGGGVAGSLDEALQRLALALNASAGGDVDAAVVDLVDGYVWEVLPSGQVEAELAGLPGTQIETADGPFAALAARRLVLAEMQRQRGTISELETLDALHSLAVNYEIVTPYSSMIVLVTAQQQSLLGHLSEASDRYQREVEGLGDTTPSSPLPLSGVPEPHEWLLIALAVAMLVYMSYRQRNAAPAVLAHKPKR